MEDGVDLALVAAIATAAATVTSAVLAALWRWLDRKEVEWGFVHTTPVFAPVERNEQAIPRAIGTLANVGDGTAYRVLISSEDCEVHVSFDSDSRYAQWKSRLLPVIAPGERLGLTVVCTPDEWERARVIIEWSAPPTRRRRRWLGMRSARRTMRIRVRDLANVPMQGR